MNFKLIAKKIMYPNSYNEEAYKAYLRAQGVLIGEHTKIYSPNHTVIDIGKPYLIKIGDYCKITTGVTILAHDYSCGTARRVYGEFLGGSLPVEIGDNVFIGMHATILMGSNIGNNCIVGAGAVVNGTFPENVVIAGNPAKVVCTLKEFYQEHRVKWVTSAKRCANAIYKNAGRLPKLSEMSGFAWMFLPHTQETLKKYPQFFQLTSDDDESVCKNFLSAEPLYESFDQFLNDCDFRDSHKIEEC